MTRSEALTVKKSIEALHEILTEPLMGGQPDKIRVVIEMLRPLEKVPALESKSSGTLESGLEALQVNLTSQMEQIELTFEQELKNLKREVAALPFATLEKSAQVQERALQTIQHVLTTPVQTMHAPVAIQHATDTEKLDTWALSQPVDLGQSNQRQAMAAFMRESFRIAFEHGWWDKVQPLATSGVMGVLGDKIALMHSELSEALEEYRASVESPKLLYYDIGPKSFGPAKPEGILAEFADVLIRIFDTVGAMGAVEQFVQALFEKQEYNKTRPYRHGGKRI